MAETVEARDGDDAVGRDADGRRLHRPSPACGARPTPANELGLGRATDGKLTTLVNVGPVNPREFAEVTSTTETLTPSPDATGGDARRLDDGGGAQRAARRRRALGPKTFKGDDWLGLKMRDASVLRGIGVLPVFAGLLGLLLLIGSLAA